MHVYNILNIIIIIIIKYFSIHLLFLDTSNKIYLNIKCARE